MIVIYHSADMDGWTSGAICKRKFPEAKLIGWDYVDEIPDFEQFTHEKVIMIDITFPIDKLQILGSICNNLTVIDHHISFKKQVDEIGLDNIKFSYIYDSNKAACEIGWEYLFPELPVPCPVNLIGRYDTWRKDEEHNWESLVLPFKYYCYSTCNSPETFPSGFFEVYREGELYDSDCIDHGRSIMKHEDRLNETLAKKNSFEVTVYEGYKALCINYSPFHSEVLKSVWDSSKYDLMLGFCLSKGNWKVSLRSEGDVDVSTIAKARGGGGHAQAAGFEVGSFEEIFM